MTHVSDEEKHAFEEEAKRQERVKSPHDDARRANGQAKPEPLRLVDPSTLQGVEIPPRRWIWPDWVPVGYATGLYGDGGAGKSLFGQQLLTAYAADTDFLGVPLTEHGRALGIFCEDDDSELHRRQAAINDRLGLQFTDIGAFHWLSRVGEDNVLAVFENSRIELTPFWYQVLDAVERFGPRLVFIDTAADVFGGDEIKRGEARQFVQSICTKLARQIDGAVILSAHPSRSGLKSGQGDGGSTGWNNAFRSRLYMECPKTDGADADPDLRQLTRKKTNYSREGVSINFRWVNWSFVREDDTSDEMWLDRQARQNRADEIFLMLLREACRQGRTLSDAPSANYAPKVISEDPAARGISKYELKLAMGRLFKAGKIRVETVGSASKQRKKLVAIEECAEPTSKSRN